MRRMWDGPLIIQGVMSKSDAEKSAAVGADGIAN
ncbi:alpha-hydroxy-acid oxidizing protein [Mesorhizobium australafricanum]